MFQFGGIRVFHRPRVSPDTDKGAIAGIRKWLEDAVLAAAAENKSLTEWVAEVIEAASHAA